MPSYEFKDDGIFEFTDPAALRGIWPIRWTGPKTYRFREAEMAEYELLQGLRDGDGAGSARHIIEFLASTSTRPHMSARKIRKVFSAGRMLEMVTFMGAELTKKVKAVTGAREGDGEDPTEAAKTST